MSLINKMLNDLEKRDAFLNDDQDPILDGLYSAYDLELTDKRKSNIPFVISISIISVILIFATLFYSFEINIFQAFTDIKAGDLSISIPVQDVIKENKTINDSIVTESELTAEHRKPEQYVNKEINTNSNISDSESELTTDTRKIENEDNHILKLDDNLLLQYNLNSAANNPLNRIDSIQFEVNDSGINLLMKLPYEIDYLVYGLTNPNRTVIELENAELGFRLEDLVPVEPIVAIRYSINDQKRFKLVLESDKPLTIRKSMTSKSDYAHDLVVVMEYQWEGSEILQQEDIELTEIVEKQVDQEKSTVFKGEIIKTPVNKDTDAYAEKLFQQAYIAYKRGNISESLKKLNTSLDQDAGHVKARSTLALILSKQGHTELAYSVLNEGLIQYPDNIEWIKMYARLLLKEEKIVEARSILAKQSPEFSSNTEYYALQAAILQKLSDHEVAAKIYRNLLQVNPLKGIWWMGLGISLESMKRYDDALYAYQKAFNNPSLAKDSREFISKRIKRLNNILEDESA
jgi:Tfp pilus assembly protein PilF